MGIEPTRGRPQQLSAKTLKGILAGCRPTARRPQHYFMLWFFKPITVVAHPERAHYVRREEEARIITR